LIKDYERWRSDVGRGGAVETGRRMWKEFNTVYDETRHEYDDEKSLKKTRDWHCRKAGTSTPLPPPTSLIPLCVEGIMTVQ